MKSDYTRLCEKYDDVILKNRELRDENKRLEKENKDMNKIIEENNYLKTTIFDLKLLLHAKVERIIKEASNG